VRFPFALQNIYYSLNTTVFQEVIGWFFDATHYNEGDDLNDEKDS